MEVVKYDIETAVITALEAKYADIVVTDGKSRTVAMEGLAEYRGLRIKIDKKHKELKQEALEYGRAVDAEKNRLKDLLAPGEQHIKDARQVYDDKIAAKKAEKERIEQERIDKINEKIQALDHLIGTTTGMSSDQVAIMCDNIVASQITEDVFQEFTEKAKEVKLATLSALDDIYNDKVIQEKEAAERKAEIEKIEKLRAEQAEAQAKIDKEKADFEAAKKAEQEKQDRAEFERRAKEKAEEQAKRQAEQEAQRKEREKAEAEIEAKRVEGLKPDKHKAYDFANAIIDIATPKVKDSAVREILTWASNEVKSLSDNIKTKIDDL